MASNFLLHAWDAVTKRMREVEWVSGAAKVYLASLLSGEDQANGFIGVADAADEYKVLAANTADQVCGSVGGANDYLGTVLLSVGAAGTVTIKDNAVTVFTHAFGAAVATPVELRINKRSTSGAWKISTGASMTGMAGGRFS